jgi:hypothetical protein
VHIKNAPRAVRPVRLRRAVILPVACLAVGAAGIVAPAAALANPTACGGDVCFLQTSSHHAGFLAWADNYPFFGHFELQTPEHTVRNSTPNKQWSVGTQYTFGSLPQDSGKYCMVEWQLVGTNSYDEIGYACMTITA